MAMNSKKRKFLATSLTATMVASAVAPVAGFAAEQQKPFSDVELGTPYTDPIAKLKQAGVITGYADGTFKIRGKVTRAEAAQMFTTIRDLNTKVAKAPFADVKSGVWYTDAINAAYAAGVVTGNPDGTFKPNGNLTRAEFAVMVVKAYDLDLKTNVKLPFKDVKEDAWYTDYIKTLYANDLIAGKTPTSFAPGENVDRGDFAILLANTDVKFGTKLNDDQDATPVVKNAVVVNTNTIKVTFSDGVTQEYALDETLQPGVATEVKVEYLGETYTVTVTYGEEIIDDGSLVVQSVEWATSQSVAAGQSLFEAGTITVKAGADGAVINGLKVNRGGLSSDDDIDSISIWDGTKRLNVPNIFSGNKADITFTTPLVLAPNETKTLSIKVNIDLLKDKGKGGDATVGAQIILSLPKDAVKTNGEVTGTIASTSNAYTIADVDLAQITAKTSPSAPTQALKPAKDNQRFAEWEVEVKEEPVKINTLVVTQDGSASDSDLRNLKIYKDGKQVGQTVTSLSARQATFVFDDGILVENGEKVRLELRGDVVSGSTRTVHFKIDNDVDLIAEDQTYGTTVTLSENDKGDDDNIFGTDNPLKIDEGELLVSRSTNSPVAAKIEYKAKDHVFTTLTVESVGEPSQLRKVKVKAKVEGSDKITAKNIENLKLVSNGKTIGQVSKPFSTGEEYELTLSNPITLKTGEKVDIDVVADLENIASDNVAKGAKITLSAAVTEAIGTISGRKAQEGINKYVDGRPMEIGAVQLTVSDAPIKADTTIDGGGKAKYVFTSQPGVVVTTYNIQHDFSQTVQLYDLVLNAENGRNLTNVRLTDADGNVLSDTITTMGNNATLKLDNPVDIAPGEVLKVQVVADIASDAEGITKISATEDTVARYKNSGERVTGIKYVSKNQTALKVADSTEVKLLVKRSVRADLDPFITTQRSAKDVVAGAFNIDNPEASAQGANIDKVFLKAELDKGAEEKDFTNIRIVNGKTGEVYGSAPNFTNGEAEITLTEQFKVERDSNDDLYILVDVASNAERGGQITVGINGLEFVQSSTGERVVMDSLYAGLKNSGALATLWTTGTNISLNAGTFPTNVDSLGGVTVGSFVLNNDGNDDVLLKTVELIDKAGTLENKTAKLGIYDGGGTLRGTLDLADVHAGTATNVEYDKDENSYIVTLDKTRRIDAGKSQTLNVRIIETGDLVGTSVQLKLGQFGTQYVRAMAAEGALFPIDDDVTSAAVVLQYADNVAENYYAPRTATTEVGALTATANSIDNKEVTITFDPAVTVENQSINLAGVQGTVAEVNNASNTVKVTFESVISENGTATFNVVVPADTEKRIKETKFTVTVEAVKDNESLTWNVTTTK